MQAEDLTQAPTPWSRRPRLLRRTRHDGARWIQMVNMQGAQTELPPIATCADRRCIPCEASRERRLSAFSPPRPRCAPPGLRSGRACLSCLRARPLEAHELCSNRRLRGNLNGVGDHTVWHGNQDRLIQDSAAGRSDSHDNRRMGRVTAPCKAVGLASEFCTARHSML